jgi:alpha-D-ribose 1-methylphosphonate 5-triphosphate diphosphatase
MAGKPGAERRVALVGGLVLRPDRDEPVPGTVVCAGGRIDTVGGPDLDPGAATIVDVGDRWVLPGIIDVHGDAFERSLMPRPGVEVDVDVALSDNDAQLLASGITTSYLSATDSWEPGLRSRDTLRSLIGGLARRRGGPDVRLHVRHERCNTDDHDELMGLLAGGVIGMLSYNDHTRDKPVSALQAQRAGMGVDELNRLQAERIAARRRGVEQERELAALAGRIGCPTASHDPHRSEDVDRDLALGVSIAEFPTTMELAERYRAAGIPVVLGAPNLVRGGSHLTNLSVAEALGHGTGDLLCSDYHYPSLLQAPFVAARRGILPFGRAWALVSAGPADAAGLDDRGRLKAGLRADVVVVDPGGQGPAVVEQVLLEGRMARLRP